MEGNFFTTCNEKENLTRLAVVSTLLSCYALWIICTGSTLFTGAHEKNFNAGSFWHVFLWDSDLKPENILLDYTGHIALCDFGEQAYYVWITGTANLTLFLFLRPVQAQHVWIWKNKQYVIVETESCHDLLRNYFYLMQRSVEPRNTLLRSCLRAKDTPKPSIGGR